MNKEIGKRIKTARENAGMTQAELAKRLNISQQMVNKYESGGVSKMPMTRLQEIADITGADPVWLFCFEEQVFINELTAAVKNLGADNRKQLLNYVRFLSSQET